MTPPVRAALVLFLVFPTYVFPAERSVHTRIWSEVTCALLLWDEATIPMAALDESEWNAAADITVRDNEVQVEEYVESRDDSLEQMLAHLEHEGKPNVLHLRKIEASLNQRSFELSKDFPNIGYLNDVSRDRWAWLQKERNYRVDFLRLSDVFNLGQLSEFEAATVDRKNSVIRLNFMFGLDAWLESYAARDLADPNTVVVQKIAEAFLEAQITEADGQPAADWIAFLHRQAKAISLGDSQIETVFAELWVFFVQRFALEEAYHYYAHAKDVGVSLYSQFFDELYDSDSEGERAERMRHYLYFKYDLDLLLMEQLWGEALHSSFTTVPQD